MEAYKILTVLSLVLMIGGPITIYFGTVLPAQIEYANSFGGEISITIDQPTFSGMSDGLTKIWKLMNVTFGTTDHQRIYGSGLYWEQTKDNSLASEDRYFRTEIQRLNNYTAQYNGYVQAGTKIITGLPITDWLDNAVNKSRHELQRNGGLDWAIQGAWYLRFHPAAYWGIYYAVVVGLLGLIGVVVGGAKWASESE